MKPSDSAGMAARMLAHRLLAFLLPLLAITSVIFLIHDFFRFIPLPGAFFWVTLVTGGVLALALTAVFRGERARWSVHAKAMAFAFLAIYAVNAAMHPFTIASSLRPSPGLLFLFFCLGAQWTWSACVESLFRDHEIFLSSNRSKDNLSLMRSIRDEGFFVTESLALLGRISMSFLISGGIIVFLLLMGLRYGAHVSTPTAYFITLFFSLFLVLQAVFRIYGNEVRYAVLGLGETFSLTGRRVRAAILLLLACAIGAACVSSGKALLPPTVFVWFLSLFKRKPPEYDSSYTGEPHPSSGGNIGEMVRKLSGQRYDGWVDLTWLYTTLKVAFLTALAAGTLYFLFGFLFQSGWRGFWSERTLMRYVRSFLSTIRGLLSSLFSAMRFRAGKMIRIESRPTFARATLMRARLAQTRMKKREIGKLTSQFMRLVRFGEDHGIPCDQAHTPGEYARALARRFPAVARDLSIASFLFEKSLYSDALLAKEEESSFAASVERVLCMAYGGDAPSAQPKADGD